MSRPISEVVTEYKARMAIPACLQPLLKMRLTGEVLNEAVVQILENEKTPDTAARHSRAQVKRDNQPSGWDSLDFASDSMLSLLERIAAPIQEEIERWRTAELNPALELELLDLSRGTATNASAKNLTQRRVQQITKKRRDDITSGQRGLFGEEVQS